MNFYIFVIGCMCGCVIFDMIMEKWTKLIYDLMLSLVFF